MSESIVVLGVHRSGTSAVAGVLYHLGLYMGDDLLGPGLGNTAGHFEDRAFVELHDQILGDWKDPQVDFETHWVAYTTLICKREQHDLWGVKDPRMCFTLPYFAEIAQSVKMVSVYRPVRLCAESLFTRGGHSREEATSIAWAYRTAKLDAMLSFHGPILDVFYERLVDEPEMNVSRIARFVGLTPTQAAIDFIDPALRHHRRQT